MEEIIKIWRTALHQVLDFYERKRGTIFIFFSDSFLFLHHSQHTLLLVGYLHSFPVLYADSRGGSLHKVTISVGFLGALFDSLSFFVTIWIIRRALASTKTRDYIFHLSLDFFIAILATLWVLFVFTFGGWLISLWEPAPENFVERSTKYTNRAVQAIQDPIGRENTKNIYFGLIMGVSAALPTFLHLLLFCWAIVKRQINKIPESESKSED